MKRYLVPALCISCVISLNLTENFGTAQSSAAQSPQTQASSRANQTTKAPLAFGLEDGTPVKLRLQRTISSADAHVDDTVDFDVLEEIKVKDLVVIPKGSVTWGTVTEAQPKRRMARGGKLNVNIDSVRLADGEKAPLRAVKDVKGGGHTGAMTGAMVATGIVFFPAAPLFLFMHGKDITIPKGTEITAYINGDAPLDPAKFGGSAANQIQATPAAPAAAAQGATQPPSSSEHSTVVLKSTPDGADITVDGKYVGSTPSTLKLAPGDHTISIEKAAFKPWQRTVTLSAGGSVSIDATLEKAP
jgi:hypothetical protein